MSVIDYNKILRSHHYHTDFKAFHHNIGGILVSDVCCSLIYAMSMGDGADKIFSTV